MKNHHAVRAQDAATAIAAQEAPIVPRFIFAAAGVGALLSGILLLSGAGDPATTSTAVIVALTLVPALTAALAWGALTILTATAGTPRTEARRQTLSAAGLMFILAVIFFFVEWSAIFELSLFFTLMLFAWGSRLQQRPLKLAALIFLLASVGLRVFDFPGEGIVLLVLGAGTLAWPFLRRPATV